jgi:hypothetical protein
MANIAYGAAYGNPALRNTSLANYTGTEAVNAGNIAANPGSTFPLIELHVSAHRLHDMDVLTVSDPICVLYTMSNTRGADPWVENARTEVVWNNLSPEWVTYFTVMYVFEVRQPLMFRVYDVDSNTAALSAHNLIGEAQIELSQIIAHPGGTKLTLTLPGRRENRGTLTVVHEEVQNSSSLVKAQFTGRGLKKMRFLFANDPFFVIAKSSEGGRFLPVYQSEVTRTMRWRPFEVSFQALCNTDTERPIRITFFDYRSTTAATAIGFYDTTFSRLCESLGQTVTIKDSTRRDTGSFTITDVAMVHKYTFYDYVRGGIQLNLIVAIDFTASNRDPREPLSLHYMSPNGDSMNQYEQCIRAVGEILCPYDSDQLFPVFGFGAKIGQRVEHCFPLTFDQQAPCVSGLDAILGAYRYSLGQVQLSGPTLFAPVITHASQRAVQSFQADRTYTILLIVTDGVINDMQDTTDAIVAAGRIPLSIIIVGVGNANFDAMDVLDADDVPLLSRSGHKMCRDLVQFVPFNRFTNRHYSVLAAEVLEEIPRQLCQWAEMNGVYPQG